MLLIVATSGLTLLALYKSFKSDTIMGGGGECKHSISQLSTTASLTPLIYDNFATIPSQRLYTAANGHRTTN